MNLNEKHIKYMIVFICIWIGIGAESIWGIRGIVMVLGIGMLWIWSNVQQRSWLGSLCFFSLVLISIGGLIKGIQEINFLSGMVGVLVIWDLERFINRLQNNESIRNKSFLIQQHIRRLGVVLGLSFALFFIAFKIDVQLKFWYAIPLIGGVFIAISYILKNYYASTSIENDKNK